MTEKEWDFDKRRPESSEIVSLFYSWDRAWRLAGITIPKNHRFSDDELLQALKDRGEFAPKSVWNSERRSPGTHVIITRFGSWRSAWERAGFKVPPEPEMATVNPAKLADARSIAKLTRKSLAENCGIPIHIIERLESKYGSDKVEVEKAKNLAKALGVSVEDLLA